MFLEHGRDFLQSFFPRVKVYRCPVGGERCFVVFFRGCLRETGCLVFFRHVDRGFGSRGLVGVDGKLVTVVHLVPDGLPRGVVPVRVVDREYGV